MRITINGEATELAQPVALSDFLAQRGDLPDNFANGVIIHNKFFNVARHGSLSFQFAFSVVSLVFRKTKGVQRFQICGLLNFFNQARNF